MAEKTIPENPQLNIPQADCAKAYKKIAEAVAQLSFLGHSLEMGRCTPEDVKTILGLYRFGFDDLSSLLDGGDTISTELEESKRMLRAANARIAELERSIGQTASAEMVLQGFKALCEAFDTWWTLAGFHYARTEYTTRGITASFSDELEKNEEKVISRVASAVFGDRQLAMVIAPYVSYQFEKGWETHSDGHRLMLADCDANRKRLLKLFKESFPNSSVIEFCSHCDRDRFLLRFKVFVPFSDVSAWREKCLHEARRSGAVRTGRLYMERIDLVSKLESKYWRKYTAQSIIEGAKLKLAKDYALIEQYESILSEGTPGEQAERLQAFAEENCLDIKEDLEGTLFG